MLSVKQQFVKISVVVTSYNSKSTIRFCLQALEQQTLQKDDYEIIVIDSSDDGTDEIIAEEFPAIILYHSVARLYYGEARNQGIRLARSPLIAFVDSDCVADTHWLEYHLNAHVKYSDVAVIGGSLVNGNPSSFWGWGIFFIEFVQYLPVEPAREVKNMVTANTSYKYWIFERYGDFQTSSYPGEDKKFHASLIESGERMMFIPDARTAHINRKHPHEILKHLNWLGQGVAHVRLSKSSSLSWVLAFSPLLAPIRTIRVVARALSASPLHFWRLSILWIFIFAGFVSQGLGEFHYVWNSLCKRKKQ